MTRSRFHKFFVGSDVLLIPRLTPHRSSRVCLLSAALLSTEPLPVALPGNCTILAASMKSQGVAGLRVLVPRPGRISLTHGVQSIAGFAPLGWQAQAKRGLAIVVRDSRSSGFENWELLVGDCVSLLSFCLYKQIAALVMMPTFPGWTAPLHFNLLRLEEFASFSLTLIGTWVASSLLLGNYEILSTATVPTALARTSLTWLLAMPIAAAQLVLLTAAENHSLVGVEGFADVLPLAASGPGEPIVSASGVLGTMIIWRSFYTIYLDYGNFQTMAGARMDRDKAAAYFLQAVGVMAVLGVLSSAGLEFLGSVLENGGQIVI